VSETEELLIHKIKQGDTSFEKLVLRYHHQIYNLALKMVNHREDARDITQETFIKAFNSLPLFRYQCGFKTWLYRIASNTCLDYLRRRNRESSRRIDNLPQSFQDVVVNIPAAGPNPEESLLLNEREAQVKNALARLPDPYRLPLLMQHYQGMSYRDISIALDISEKTVATRVYRAKMMMKQFLTGGENGEMQTGERKTDRVDGRGVHLL